MSLTYEEWITQRQLLKPKIRMVVEKILETRSVLKEDDIKAELFKEYKMNTTSNITFEYSGFINDIILEVGMRKTLPKGSKNKSNPITKSVALPNILKNKRTDLLENLSRK